MARYLRPVNLGTVAASKAILGQPCILVGYSLRETTGLAAAEVEFINGADANGEAVAEVAIQPPPLAVAGQIDTDIDASSALAAAANNVTLAAVAAQTTFITGFEITGDGATAGSIIAVTVTGILGGTKTYFLTIPLGAGVALTPLIVAYSRPIPASVVNTAIVVNVPSFGLGNTNAAVTAHGFQRVILPSGSTQGQAVSLTLPYGGLPLRSGLFMRILSGSVTGAVWVRL